jgi:hypothetical protein
MKKLLLIIFHSLPLFSGILLSYLFWRQNLLLLVIYSVFVFALICFGKERKAEFLIFVYGSFVGFIIETIGTQISGYQSFTQPDTLGIPYWLVVSWGFGFLLMKRIGLIIATNSPWAEK